MKSTFLSTLLLFIFSGISSTWAQERTCSSSDFQSCKSCAQLESAIDLEEPNAGDYYKGAEWNGLFSAYVLNCPVIAAKLIEAGANASSGGTSDSMILTVASKWPHDDKSINDAWAALLFIGGASMDKRLRGRQGKDTKEVLEIESGYSPDYFDLFILFQD